jgi:hypothetical protein
MKLIHHKADTLSASETEYVPLAVPAQLVSIFVDNSSNVTVSVTNSTGTIGASSLWSTLTLTSNAASIAGPITGVRLVANGSGGSYCIAAGVQSSK